MTAAPLLSFLASLALQQAPDTLTLGRALDLARRHRGVGIVAASATAEARARAGMLGMIPNPSAQYKHSESSPTEEAQLEQRFDWVVSRWAGLSAGRADMRGARADSIQLEADLGRDVRIAWYEALTAAETRRLMADQFRLADSLRFLAAERVVAGEISVIEREQFAVEAGRARQAFLQAEEDDQVARAALERATGTPTVNGMVLAGSADWGLELPIGGDPPDAAEVPALQRALADSAEAQALHRAANLSRIPVPSLILGRKWDSGSPFASASDAIIGMSLPIPLWNIGSAPAAAAAARAQRAAALAGEKRSEVAASIVQHSARLVAAHTRALYSRDSLLPRARRLREGVTRLYRAGGISVLPVFDALRSEREIAIASMRDLLAWQRARANWLALLGRTE